MSDGIGPRWRARGQGKIRVVGVEWMRMELRGEQGLGSSAGCDQKRNGATGAVELIRDAMAWAGLG